MTVQSHVRYERNPEVVVKEEDPDGALIFNPETDQIRVLNATGFFIWSLCNGERDAASIVSQMEEAFADVPASEMPVQVKAFLEEMHQAGFVGILED